MAATIVSMPSLGSSSMANEAGSLQQKVKLRLCYGGLFEQVCPRRAGLEEQAHKKQAQTVVDCWCCLLCVCSAKSRGDGGRQQKGVQELSMCDTTGIHAGHMQRARTRSRRGVSFAARGCRCLPTLTSVCCCLLLFPSLHSHNKQTANNSYKYVGGEYFNESIPYGIRYADFMFKLSEKFKTAVSVKYHAPGEELVPDQLISVQDDADLQVRGGVDHPSSACMAACAGLMWWFQRWFTSSMFISRSCLGWV